MRTGHMMMLIASLAAVLLSATALHAQQRERPRRDGPADRETPTPEAMRTFITRQLDRTQTQQDRMHKALDMLERGDAPDTVRKFLRENGTDQRRRGRESSEVSRENILATLAELNPTLHKRLMQQKERNPRRFERQVRRLFPRLRELARLRHDDPEKWEIRAQLFRSEQRARFLARRATGALTDEEREVSTRQLREVVNQQFTLRQRMYELELQRAQARIAEQQQRLQDANSRRDEFVMTRVSQVLQKAAEDELLGDGRPEPPQPSDQRPRR